MICNYGCGQEATYQFKNGKWCCNIDHRKCPAKAIKVSIKLKGKPKSEEHKKKLSKPKSEETKIKMRKPSIKKKLAWTENRKIKQKEYMLNGRATYLNSFITQKSIEKLKISLKEAWKDPSKFDKNIYRDRTRKQLLNGHSEFMNSKPRDPEKIKINSEKSRQRLLSGDAVKMIKCIKRISKPELKLRDMVSKLFKNFEFQYKVFNYALDIAIPKYKIAIEYDGWYHFNNEESIEYFKQRQEKIEGEGWVFIKYTCYDKFPKLEKVKEDIEKRIGEICEKFNN